MKPTYSSRDRLRRWFVAVQLAAAVGSTAQAGTSIDMEGSVAGVQLPESALVALLATNRDALKVCLGREPRSAREVRQFFEAVGIDLNDDGVRDYVVRGACSAFRGAHSKRFWVLLGTRNETGITYAIVAAESGVVLQSMGQRTLGFVDLRLESQFSSSKEFDMILKWDGQHYRESACRTWDHDVRSTAPRWGKC